MHIDDFYIAFPHMWHKMEPYKFHKLNYYVDNGSYSSSSNSGSSETVVVQASNILVRPVNLVKTA